MLCLLGGAVAPAWAKGGGDSSGHGSDGGGGSGSGGDDGGSSNSGSGSDDSGSDDSGSDDNGGGDSGADGAGGGRDRSVAGEVVITAPDIDYPALRALGYPIIRERRLAALGLTVIRVRVLPPRDMDEAIAAIRAALPRSEVGLNGLYGLEGASSAEPPAPLSGEFLWPARLMGWSAAAGDCAAGLRIGVIDTPIDLGAPTLLGAVIQSYGAADLDGSPAESRHGTIVASLMAGQGPVMAGLVPKAEVFYAAAVQSIDGRAMASATAIAAALDWMVSEKVAVVNISLAGPDTPCCGKWSGAPLPRACAWLRPPVTAAPLPRPPIRRPIPAWSGLPPSIAWAACGRNRPRWRHRGWRRRGPASPSARPTARSSISAVPPMPVRWWPACC
nr:S8 family serine peptidase [Oleomonas cavernae]